jgi:hypothetical protein
MGSFYANQIGGPPPGNIVLLAVTQAWKADPHLETTLEVP